LFTTSNLGLAAYLIAAKKLRYTRTIGKHPDPAEFVFDDPNSVGPELELAYINNEATVVASDFLTRVKFLRRSIDLAEKQRVADARQARESTSQGGRRG
jgi:hypothetical protein